MCSKFDEDEARICPERDFMTKVSILLPFHCAIQRQILLGVFLLMVIYLWGKVVFNPWFVARVFSFTYKINKPYVVSKYFS